MDREIRGVGPAARGAIMAARVRLRAIDNDEGNRLLRIVYFALDGADHPDHATQSRMIRRYIAWRNRNAHGHNLRRIVDKANVA
jgi:hypothetical protein